MPPVKVTYRVEPVVPEAARRELTRLWSANLIAAGDVERKFEWLYREAPDRPASAFLLAAQDGVEESWVGTAGVGVRRVRAGGRELRAGLLADLAVDKDHRTVAPALALVRAVKAWVFGDGGFDLAYGFPNRLAEGVFKRVGYAPLGTIGRWARVLRHAAYAPRIKQARLERMPAALKRVVDRAVDVPVIAAVAGGAVDAVQLARAAPSAMQAARRIELDWVDVADERIDAVWDAAKDEYEVAAVRTARFLTWRFPAAPEVSVVVASARGGGPVAYAVVEQGGDGVAHLRDLFGTREAVSGLLDRLPPALYVRGAHSVSIRYLGDPWLVAALEARGFSRRDSSRVITIGVSPELDDASKAALADANSWHLTDADEDA
jgi:hypothetical protein